ncbi:hypothetical protein JXJ21_12120 [candidate division KSB1 bacterium]|nr:hypothetical protein [candidate division KSB1 bacterium]
MQSEKYKELITLLAKKSRQNEIHWQTTARESEFIANLLEFTISISQESSASRIKPNTSLKIFDGNGRLVDTLTDDEDDGYSLLKMIYVQARRNANEMGSVIEKLVDALR